VSPTLQSNNSDEIVFKTPRSETESYKNKKLNKVFKIAEKFIKKKN
jgi:hypothetical protein